jgi:ribose transport system substrate-binding protein
MKATRLFLIFMCALTFLGGNGCNRQQATAPIAYVTNGVDPFWDLCAAGVRQAEAEFNIKCAVLMPANGLADQQRMLEDLLARGVRGIAVSTIAGEGQTQAINEACKKAVVITQDSDSPNSDRQVFIGTDNYKAGRACGQLVLDALPEGGSVMIFVGRMDQDNAKLRRQGVIDVLLGKNQMDVAKKEFSPLAGELKNDKFTILGTRTDQFDYAKAKSNAEDAIAAHGDLDCMVGLFAYNIPHCMEAVKAADKLGKIKLVSFDEHDVVLEAIKSGDVQGTVSQQPWKYGYESVRVLKALLDGDRSVIPANKFIEIPFLTVTKNNVGDFIAEKKKMEELGKKK